MGAIKKAVAFEHGDEDAQEARRLKRCTGKPVELSNEWEVESQKGNPG